MIGCVGLRRVKPTEESMIIKSEVDMARSKNDKPSSSTQSAAQPSPASASAKPGKHQSTPDELKAWVESKGLQPPR